MVERKNEDKGCKSPTHVEGCPCRMCNKTKEACKPCKLLNTQHLIPESIGRKILGMSKNQLNEYTRKESKPCHRENDVRVPMVYEEMRLRKNTEHILFSKEAVLMMRKTGYFRG